MMRSQTALTCAVGALLAATLSFGLAPQQDTDPQVAALQRRIVALEESLETYDAFLAAQAKAGKGLVDALNRSEEEGFTAGINPHSREILLKGLHAQAEAMQAGAGNEKAVAPRGGRGRRRGK